jgi:NNP family nitrate/nitrite transporter-like MFS transporter
LDRDKADAPAPFGEVLGPLLLFTFIFYLNFSSRVAMGPLSPRVEADLGLTHSQAGAMFFMVTLGYFIGMIGSGFLSARLAHRWVVLISALWLGAALIMVGFAQSAATMSVAFIMVGLTGGLYMPSAVASITELTIKAHWGRAIAVHEVAPNLGFVLTPFIAEAALLRADWRVVFWGLGATSILAGLAFIVFGRGGRGHGRPPEPKAVKAIAVQPAFWITMALFSLGLSASMGVYSMFSLYMVHEVALPRSAANVVLSLSRVSGLFVAFLAGWVADRYGPVRALKVIFVATGLLTVALALTPGATAKVVIYFAQALFAAAFFPVGFAVLARIGGPEERSLVVSLALPLAIVIGSGLMPTLIGYMGEHHSFALGLSLVGLLVTAGAGLARYLRV